MSTYSSNEWGATSLFFEACLFRFRGQFGLSERKRPPQIPLCHNTTTTAAVDLFYEVKRLAVKS